MMYSIGLKGVETSDMEKAEALVTETLSQLVKDGINQDDIEAAPLSRPGFGPGPGIVPWSTGSDGHSHTFL